MIRVEDLRKSYVPGHAAAVDGLSFSVAEGSFYTLLGPSGCGKTTTLRCIAGLERPEGGTIELGGVVVLSDRVFLPAYRRDIGMVFQSYAVWPHMSVFDNVAFPLQVGKQHHKQATIDERVRATLELVGLAGFERRPATQLSGGQQQRLSLARALVREPSVLLLDEPLSNLDAKLRERMRAELLLIQQRVGVTTLFVTHDQVEALSMSDRIAVMDGGRIVQEGSAREIYHRPANEFVVSFIGSVNLVRGRLAERDPTSGRCRVETAFGTLVVSEAPGAVGANVVAAVRPEDVALHRMSHHASEAIGPNSFSGTVAIGLFGGTSVEYHVDLDGLSLRARIGSRFELERGDVVQLQVPPEAIRVFAGDDLFAPEDEALAPGGPGPGPATS